MRKSFPTAALLLVLAATVSSCTQHSKEQVLVSNASQVELRSIQTRAFDTDNREEVMRTVISTMQDLDFLIEKADLELGTITGSKFVKTTPLKMTVVVRPRGTTQQLVRANAQFGLKEIADAEPYQDFFVALEKALFLTSHNVD